MQWNVENIHIALNLMNWEALWQVLLVKLNVMVPANLGWVGYTMLTYPSALTF